MTVYPEEGRVWGCDVSFYQDENETARGIDFNKMKAEGAEFVFIRAGQATWIDPDFAVNWGAAKEAGLLRGAYWFLDARYSANTQATLFKNLLTDPGELRPVVDYECELPMVIKDKRGKTKTVPAYNTIIQLNGFLATLNWPVKPMIYTGYWYWTDHGSRDAMWADYPLWIANYDIAKPNIPAPWKTWIFWQFTEAGPGRVLGAESNGIDLDYFNGTEAELLKYANKPADQPPTPPAEAGGITITGDVTATYTDSNGQVYSRTVRL